MSTKLHILPAAIIAFVSFPSMAQATQLQAPAGTELANGSTVKMQSSNFTIQLEKKDGSSVGEFKCNHVEYTATVTKNQGEDVAIQIASKKFTGCVINGLTGDGTSKASSVLQIQQPDESGVFVGHIAPEGGEGVFHNTVQPQAFGFSITTCDFSASNVQLHGSVGSNVLTAEGTQQYTVQSGSPDTCGEVGTFHGSFTLTSGVNAVTVDMI